MPPNTIVKMKGTKKCPKKKKDDVKEKAKAVAEEAAQKAKEAGKAAAAKADELYNKLPLDKINEKLGGKVDVKSRKFKIIGACVLLGLVILLLSLAFGGDGTPTSAEISGCKYRLNKLESTFGEGRRCIDVYGFKKMSPITPPNETAKLLGLKPGVECQRFKCTVKWKGKKTSEGLFVRQGKKCGIFLSEWRNY